MKIIKREVVAICLAVILLTASGLAFAEKDEDINVTQPASENVLPEHDNVEDGSDEKAAPTQESSDNGNEPTDPMKKAASNEDDIQNDDMPWPLPTGTPLIHEDNTLPREEDSADLINSVNNGRNDNGGFPFNEGIQTDAVDAELEEANQEDAIAIKIKAESESAWVKVKRAKSGEWIYQSEIELPTQPWLTIFIILAAIILIALFICCVALADKLRYRR